MAEQLTSAAVGIIAAGVLWGAARVAGADGYPVTIRPAAGCGCVLVEAISRDRAIAYSLEVPNGADLPRPIALNPGDLLALKRKNGEARMLQIETVSGGDPEEGPLLAVRIIDGQNNRGVVCPEAEPLPRLPLADLPSPWWEPGPVIPSPVLLNVERMRLMLHALNDAKACREIELIVTADHPVVGIALRAWGDIDDLTGGSVQLMRCLPLPPGGVA